MRGKQVISDPKAREKPCLRCGYSLRKIEDSRHCPECGLSVWLSLSQNDTLEFSNPEWVNRQRLGAVVLAGSQVFGLLLSIATIALWRIPALRQRLTDGWIDALPPALAVYFWGFAAGLMILRSNEERHPDLLKTHRWALLIGGGFLAAIGLLIAISRTRAGAGAVAMTFLCAIPTFVYLRRVALRLPSVRAARVCRWLLLIPALWLLVLFRENDRLWLLMLDGLVVLYLLASLALFSWFAVALRKATADARRTWAAETASGAVTSP